MIALDEHPDHRVQALAAARVGHKSTIEQTRTARLLKISLLQWPDGSTGKAPIPLRYGGAHTHRLSGDWKLNPQNWSTYTHYEDHKETGLLRRAHEAPPGHKVVKRDASQIEARVVSWVSEQDDLTEAFRQKRDVYCEFGTEVIYKRPITKADTDERFICKGAILGCGFGVGPDKFRSDIAAKSYVVLGKSIVLDVTQAGNIVGSYRTRYSKIPAAWKVLQNIIPQLARDNSGIEFGPVRFEKQAILLPNGLRLFYHDLHFDKDRDEWMFKYGKTPKKLYGGKMFENIVQALARIITMNAALKMRRLYPQVQLGLAHQVHDDLVFIVPDELVTEFDQALADAMNNGPEWSRGLPLASEGGVGPNYGEAK
jgi:hypothetical protein